MSRDRWGGARAARPPAFRLRKLRRQLDRSGGGCGRSRTTDVRRGIRDLITGIGRNGGYGADSGPSRAGPLWGRCPPEAVASGVGLRPTIVMLAGVALLSALFAASRAGGLRGR